MITDHSPLATSYQKPKASVALLLWPVSSDRPNPHGIDNRPRACAAGVPRWFLEGALFWALLLPGISVPWITLQVASRADAHVQPETCLDSGGSLDNDGDECLSPEDDLTRFSTAVEAHHT